MGRRTSSGTNHTSIHFCHRDLEAVQVQKVLLKTRSVCLFLPHRYDDYDYGEINQLLDRSFKVYIKTVVCTPEKTTKRMYDSFWRQFEHSEKVQCACELRGWGCRAVCHAVSHCHPAGISALADLTRMLLTFRMCQG